MIARRSRMLTRLPNAGTSDHERELRTSWEENASAVSRDPKLIRQIFALLQEVEVAPADMEQPSAFNLAPARKALAVELPAPASDRLPRVRMVLAASGATECTLHGVPLNGPVMECLKGLNQVVPACAGKRTGVSSARAANRFPATTNPSSTRWCTSATIRSTCT